MFYMSNFLVLREKFLNNNFQSNLTTIRRVSLRIHLKKAIIVTVELSLLLIFEELKLCQFVCCWEKLIALTLEIKVLCSCRLTLTLVSRIVEEKLNTIIDSLSRELDCLGVSDTFFSVRTYSN